MAFSSPQRTDMAMAQVNVALDLDPLSPFVHTIGAVANYLGGAYPEAERLARRALNLQPNNPFGLFWLAVVLTVSGRVVEAIPVAEHLVALSRTPPTFVSLLGIAFGLAGRTDDMTQLEHELKERRSRGEYISPFSFVSFAIARGDGAMLRRVLEDCLADSTPFSIIRTGGPLLDAWRTDGAIDELLLRLGDGVRPPSRMSTDA